MSELIKLRLPEKWVEGIQLFWGIWFVCMLSFTKYGTSMSIIGFGVLGFYLAVTHYEAPFRLYFKKWLSLNGQSYSYFALTMIFWIIVFGFINSDNIQYWLSRVRIRLPFLALPVVFYWLQWSLKSKRIIVSISVLIIFAASTFVAIRYFIEFDKMNEFLKAGSPIPVPMKDHVRYAQLQSFVLLSGIYWLIQDAGMQKKFKKILSICLVAIFFYIHLFAVRSGLLITYTGLVVMIFFYFNKLKIWQWLTIMILLVFTAFGSVKLIPSLDTKIKYMVWDFQEFLKGEHLNNSDSGRWISYDAGLKIYRQNKLFGVGPGDIDDQVREVFKNDYPEIKQYKLPHNQFLHTLASSGWAGLILFTGLWVTLLVFAFRHNNKILAVLTFATFASFMVESPLETARGTALIAFWLAFWVGENLNRKPAHQIL